MTDIEKARAALRADAWKRMRGTTTDQQAGVPMPPLQAPAPEDAERIDLVAPDALTVGAAPLRDVAARRQSLRRYADTLLTLEELSFLLWMTQGVRRHVPNRAVFRTVPSAGARHPFETYLVINKVEGLDVGLYRYLSLEHQLCRLDLDPTLPKRTAVACHDQSFVADSAVTVVWVAIPYRTVWRYGEAARKLVALDAGHACQNLYLAAEAIDAGACAIAAYDQDALDAVLGLDGEEQFAVYVAPVGKRA
jgi:SagB-type dehydrogenase family enzyme